MDASQTLIVGLDLAYPRQFLGAGISRSKPLALAALLNKEVSFGVSGTTEALSAPSCSSSSNLRTSVRMRRMYKKALMLSTEL